MFGPMNPTSLPEMLSRQMAPGMIPGPVPSQKLTPGFRAAGSGGAPGLLDAQQMPGMGMDPNMMAMMAMAMRGKPGATRTGGDADMNNYGGRPTMTPGEDANGNPIMLPNPNQPDPSGGGWGGWLASAKKGLF